MNIQQLQNQTTEVGGLKELSGAGASAYRDSIRRQLGDGQRILDIDLSQTAFVDSSGLGALIALHKTMRERGGQLRLINPSPVCQQLIELTRLHRTFEIVLR